MRKFVGGSFRTGDYGRIDEDGYLYIEGRIDGGIVSGGENVDPETVERAAISLDEIADAVAFGARDPEWGEAVCLATRIADGARFDANAIREKLRQLLADYQTPKRIYQIHDSIRNEMGKPLRMELRRRFETR
jgi:acyl-CoA synthetase (AMP-forming)/AMP-acid ligase II